MVWDWALAPCGKWLFKFITTYQRTGFVTGSKKEHGEHTAQEHELIPQKHWTGVMKSQRAIVWVQKMCHNIVQVSINKIKLTVVHEATVAEPHTQHHSILSSGTVSLGNQNQWRTQSIRHKASPHLFIQNTRQHSWPDVVSAFGGGKMRMPEPAHVHKLNFH